MRILLRRSGGFIGVTMECRVESDDLADPERRELEELVAAAHPETLHTALTEGGVDLFRYDLSIDRPEDSVEVSYDDGTLPEPVLPLIEWLAGRLTAPSGSTTPSPRRTRPAGSET